MGAGTGGREGPNLLHGVTHDATRGYGAVPARRPALTPEGRCPQSPCRQGGGAPLDQENHG